MKKLKSHTKRSPTYNKMKKDTRGTISVFILLLLIPMIFFTSIMVDWARFNMAHSRVKNAAYLVVGSALAFYDGLLLEVYGLLAMSQDRENMVEFSNEAARMAVALDASGNQLHQTFNLLGNVSLDLTMGAEEEIYSLENIAYLQSQLMEYMRFRSVMSLWDMDRVVEELEEEAEEGGGAQDPEFAENEIEFINGPFLDAMELLYELHTHYSYIVEKLEEFEEKIEELNELKAATLGQMAINYNEISSIVNDYIEDLISYNWLWLQYNIAYAAWLSNTDDYGNPIGSPPSQPTMPTPVLDVATIQSLYQEIYDLTYAFDDILPEIEDILEEILERTQEADALGIEIRQKLEALINELTARRGVDISEAFADAVIEDITEILEGGETLDDDGNPGEPVKSLIVPELLETSATEFKEANLALIIGDDGLFTGTLGTSSLQAIRSNAETYKNADYLPFNIISGSPSANIEFVPFNITHREHLDEILDREMEDPSDFFNEQEVDQNTNPRSLWQQIMNAIDPAGVLTSPHIEGLPDLQNVRLPELRERVNEGLENNILNDLMARFLTAEYGVQMFTNLVTNRRMVERDGITTRANDERMLSGIPFGTNINYAFGGELEFIFWGNENIQTSLEATIRSLYGVFMARNLLYTFQSPAIRNEIRKIRAVPKVGFLLAELYRLTVANEETRIDLHTVLNGARTPLLKNPRARNMPNRSAEWRTGIFYRDENNAWGTQFPHRVPEEIGRGLHYYQWLRILIMVTNSPATTTHRIGHLIEHNLNHHLGLKDLL